MRMSYGLNLVQTQKLIMTPELKQAIEILQYNSVELNQFIQEELLNNPILEVPQDKSEIKNSDLIDWKEYFKYSENFSYYNKNVDYEEREEVSFDNFVSNETTLTDHLLFQLQFTLLKGEKKLAAEYIIENIDTNGYLRLDNKEIMMRYRLSEDEVENIIKIIQTFEPVGVGARNLRECLLIQLENKGIKDKIIYKIVSDFLDELASNKINYISKKLNISPHEVQKAVDFIKTLEPKPGRTFSSLRDVKYITPDVIVEKIDNEYIIVVNDITAPKLTINNYYRKLLLNSEIGNNTSSYINRKLNSAIKIIKSIQQRRNTIYKVVKAIVNYQKEFFDKGTIYLKPLTLREIADEIGMHESTVSRAVNGKYLQCPRGIFELKYFFQSGVSNNYGDGMSAESIKSIIKELIDGEDSKKPLSDQAISNELNKIGIKISRRTVAKYRDEMKIPSSSKRKRY
ncbi:RNA polymerase, sigma 54 subunit, RpoN/SigL [Caminicella sporogenes DSM 14501]|uniref:RNA polymerase, sigma 54 subunit, RpoN/SigL n=1 Tax=Caminicella sporogenes DSM 14501 TaxID=1121266 RepID=A0A1M6MLC9_9FIRM|nr:RNA polymerase factor sigma-54 [Caminicella sporogenes]RKD27499.1 RNA polymerase sigma-54 factor [Caminicella sporogenes]WIF94929.1 RNA polymerase factor sigma-54 [Caminicella sporogenes]SHJ84281.1 RNA polymerase, sigma 54 subunit, RpoN/SigL [Caminicella sporogenes DSM 14501]